MLYPLHLVTACLVPTRGLAAKGTTGGFNLLPGRGLKNVPPLQLNGRKKVLLVSDADARSPANTP